MGLAFVLLYVALNLLSPAEMIPSLSDFRPMLVLTFICLPPVILTYLSSPEMRTLRVQFFLVLAFLGWVTCSWLPHGWLRGGLYAFYDFMPNVIVYFFAIAMFRSPGRLRMVRTATVLVAAFVIANAILEYSYAKAGVLMPYALPYEGMVRIRGLGLLNDPNTFGQFLLQTLPLLFVGKRDGKVGAGIIFVIPVALLFVVGVFLTGSRGSELGLVVLIGLFLSRRFKTPGVILSIAAGAVLLVVFNAFAGRSISMSGGMDRLAIWSDGLSFFKSSPVWGIGIGKFMELQGLTAHNSFLLCAAELGMIGFFIWMSIMVVTMFQLSQVSKVLADSNPELARWALAVRLSLSVYLFTSFFLSRAYDMPLFLILGMAGAIVIMAGGDNVAPLYGTRWPVWSFTLCVAALGLIYVMLRLRAF